jgi:hypothetical protein
MRLNSAGNLGIGTTGNPDARLHVNLAGNGNAAAPSTKGIIVRGAASQTANLFEVQASNGGTYLSVNSKHTVFMQSIASTEKVLIVRSSSNGTSAADANAIDIQNGWGNTVAYVKPTGSAYFSTTLASVVPLTVKGDASQTANLFEVQNSAGTALFSIDKDGSVAAGTVPVARVSGLHAVATSGDYADLSNTPTVYTPTKEVLTSLVDGTETEFVLAATPNAGAYVQVFVNGLLQSEGASEDYTISGDTITFNTAPESGWKLIVCYFV